MPPEATETNAPPSSSSGLLASTSLDASASSQWTPSTVLSTLPAYSQPPSSPPSSPIAFFHLLERLKTTKREGWRRFDITHGESISDHMYRMSIMTLLCPPSLSSRIDLTRCTKMALVHDMAELLVGDITPVDGVPKSEKNRRESTTMNYLCQHLLGSVDGGAQGKEIKQLWQEYEDSETLESTFVHDIDKMELVLQMLDYERSGKGQIDLGEFSHVAKRIQLPEVRSWCEEVLKERAGFWKGVGKSPSGGEEIGEERKKQLDGYYANGSKTA